MIRGEGGEGEFIGGNRAQTLRYRQPFRTAIFVPFRKLIETHEGKQRVGVTNRRSPIADPEDGDSNTISSVSSSGRHLGERS